MYVLYFFFFNDTATTEIYTLSLHDALPIFNVGVSLYVGRGDFARAVAVNRQGLGLGAVELEGHLLQVEYNVGRVLRSEEHTSELQSRQYLVCRLLLEKKTNNVPARL